MYGDKTPEMPTGFVMALAHNTTAMSNFLRMSNDEQDNLILRARETKTQRQMQQLVNSIGEKDNM